MAVLRFKDLRFQEKGEYIRVIFLRQFYFDIKRSSLEAISDFKVDDGSIDFKDAPEKKARNKFNMLIEEGFKRLKSRIYDRKAVYVHQNSGIPLIGTNYFGLVDRGTNIIEIKPITGCNLDCIYCSVDEGKSSRKNVDFVVEKDYLVKELKEMVRFKAVGNIEAHINAQGEPLLYADIVELVKDISSIKPVKVISIDTNGVMLTKSLVDELVRAGLTRFNLSINALDKELAQRIANCSFDVGKVIETAEYISKKADLIITPVWIPGVNDQEMPGIIEFTKSLQNKDHNISLGIQNFLEYRFGRNPVKEMPFDSFYSKLSDLEKRHDMQLIIDCSKYDIIKTRQLPKPFKKGEVVKARVVCPGRLKNEKLAVAKAVAKGRVISIPCCFKEGDVKVRITRTKHNVFMGSVI